MTSTMWLHPKFLTKYILHWTINIIATLLEACGTNLSKPLILEISSPFIMVQTSNLRWWIISSWPFLSEEILRLRLETWEDMPRHLIWAILSCHKKLQASPNVCLNKPNYFWVNWALSKLWAQNLSLCKTDWKPSQAPIGTLVRLKPNWFGMVYILWRLKNKSNKIIVVYMEKVKFWRM